MNAASPNPGEHDEKGDPNGIPLFVARCSDSQKSVEKVAVALERETKVFGGRFLAARPLVLEPGPGLREARGQLFDRRRHQPVSPLHAFARIIDEARLHVVPPVAKVGQIVFGEKSGATG